MIKNFAKYWYIPFIAAAAWLTWVFSRKRETKLTPALQIRRELEAVEAKAEVARVKASLGASEALKHVEDKFGADLAKLEGEKKAEAERLSSDPELLARFLVRNRE